MAMNFPAMCALSCLIDGNGDDDDDTMSGHDVEMLTIARQNIEIKKNTTCLIAGQLNEHVLISCNPRTRYMYNKTYLLSEYRCSLSLFHSLLFIS